MNQLNSGPFVVEKSSTKVAEDVHQPKIGGRCGCIAILYNALDTLNSVIVIYRYMCRILQNIICLSSQTLKKQAIVLMFQSGHLPPFFFHQKDALQEGSKSRELEVGHADKEALIVFVVEDIHRG